MWVAGAQVLESLPTTSLVAHEQEAGISRKVETSLDPVTWVTGIPRGYSITTEPNACSCIIIIVIILLLFDCLLIDGFSLLRDL